MPTSNDLLADSSAIVELIVVGTYLDETNTPNTVYFSQHGWQDQIEGPAGTYFPPLLSTSLQIDQLVNPLEPSASFGAASELVFLNDADDFSGYFDSWWKYSVDQREWKIYTVGTLSDGTRVELADVIATPFFSLLGKAVPEVNETECIIQVRSGNYILDTPVQPDTYSPPCLLFPGSVPASVSLGDNLDLTSSFALSLQFSTDNPASSTAQYLAHKDSGTTGYYVAVGLVGGGTVSGGVEVCFRGRSTATSTSAAGILRASQSYTLDISEDTAAGTRRVDLDGATIITVSSLTGSPTSNSTTLTFGSGLVGKLGRVLYWAAARSNATMSAEIKIPFIGSESGLTAYFPNDEGVGSTINDRKTGSSLTGTLASGVLWGNSTFHYASLLGQTRPFLIGTSLRAPVTWLDTTKQIAEVSYGGCAHIAELQSNHAAVSAGNWTPTLAKGILTLTSGSISGTYSTTATANNLWNSALLFSSTSTALATITSPTGASPGPGRSLTIQCRPDFTNTLLNLYLCGWHVTTAAGAFFVRVTTGAVNRLQALIINDAGTQFSITYDRLNEGRTYSIAAVANPAASLVLDCPANTMRLYVDGEVVGSVALTGVFTATQATYGAGCRSNGTLSWIGRIDEPLIFNRVISQAEVRALHLLPAESAMSGMTNGWHLDEGISSAVTASPFAGATSLTLTNLSWTGGRSACTDLARWLYYENGYDASDLDLTTWRTILNSQPSDCGIFVTPGMTGKQALDILFGGLGIIRLEVIGIWYLYRFEGVPASPALTLTEVSDLEAADIESEEPDPAIWEWTITYATNATPMEQSTVAQSLATSDPDRYRYAQQKEKSAVKSDYSIKATSGGGLGRFPNAESLTRQTALLYTRDAEAEATRLLALHRYGADVKTVAAFITAGTVQPLTGVEFIPEFELFGISCEIDETDWVIIGPSAEDDRARVTVWRPGPI